MKRGFVPHADSLIAFECAARHGSFTRAAEELHLTQGAISKQVRHLETRLGVDLFKRVRQRIVLTDAGRLYLHDVRSALEHLTSATRQVMSFAGNADVLNLATLPSFGTRWLAPRLSRFVAQYPTASFNLAVRLRPFDFAKEPFDAAIHYGEPVWAGAIAERLFHEDVIAVASPGFRDRYRIDKPADLAPLMRLHQSTRPLAWRQWFEAAGVETDMAFQGPRFEQFVMMAQAAAHDLGAALVPRFFVGEELADGRLVQLFDTVLRLPSAYHLVYPEDRTLRPVVSAFRDWLIGEVSRDPPYGSDALR
ncbi:LysR family transcriptional regulator [Stappia taiwanensis]|uniref:LysR family transcriptional regulator n=1 Tax=Stappia taiwanensis TaxID=992267 RepID=A0A838XYB7_9HYPH|nr:LysR substrate-binding domain-containing protein [Stappia taiwanensis]MBA4611873.1 LysR family transcriptional regulator [Stappia taiwanensis]GGF03458.1 transcriptional regulator [Stappia taiwanensis]